MVDQITLSSPSSTSSPVSHVSPINNAHNSRGIVNNLALINAFRANDYPRVKELILHSLEVAVRQFTGGAESSSTFTPIPSASSAAPISPTSSAQLAYLLLAPLPPYGSPLHLAISFSSFNIIKQIFVDFKLQVENVWINSRNSPAAQTPLHIACSLNNKDVIPLLLSIDKLDDTAIDSNGQTALDIAISHASPSGHSARYAGSSSHITPAEATAAYIVKLLTEHQKVFSKRVENTIIQNLRNGTPEFIVASFSSDQRFDSYINLRLININVPYNSQTKQTILHYAAMKNDLSLCNWALRHGADVALKDLKHKRPIDYCSKSSETYQRLVNFIDQTPIISKSLTQASITGKQPLEAPVMKGTLSKWVNLALGYKPRYFVLENGYFGYYKSEADYPSACRSIVDTAIIQTTMPDADDKTRFDVLGKGSIKIAVKAASANQAKQWVWALMESKKYSQDQHRNQLSIENAATSTENTGHFADLSNSSDINEAHGSKTNQAGAYGRPAHYINSSDDDDNDDDDDELDELENNDKPLPNALSASALSFNDVSDNTEDTHKVKSADDKIFPDDIQDNPPLFRERGLSFIASRPLLKNTKIGRLNEKLFSTLDVLDQAVVMHKDVLKDLPKSDNRNEAIESFNEITKVIDDTANIVQKVQKLYRRTLAKEKRERKQMEVVFGRVVERGYEDAPLEPIKPEEETLSNGGLTHHIKNTGLPNDDDNASTTDDNLTEDDGALEDDSDADSVEFYDANDDVASGRTDSLKSAAKDVISSPTAVSRVLQSSAQSIDGNGASKECNLDSPASIIGKLRKKFSISLNKHHMAEIGYPLVPRSTLPLDPSKPAPKLAIWSFLKSAFGKDLTRLTLPVHFNEPLSMLQRLAEDIQDSYILNKASRIDDPNLRILNVGAFAISNYSTTIDRTGKPFNPVLGETFEYCGIDNVSKADGDTPIEYRYLSEQVCHHPPISACHCTSKYFAYWAEVNMLSKFWGKSLQLLPQGANYATLTLPDGTVEKYTWKKVTTTVHNLVVGKLWLDHSGDMIIRNLTRNIELRIEFVPNAGWFTNANIVGGELKGEIAGTPWKISGNWSSNLNAINTETKKEISIWKSSTKFLREYFNLTEFAIGLNQLDDNNKILMSNLPLSDCRRRKDQREMEKGNYDKANDEKTLIENLQRKRRNELIAAASAPGAKANGPEYNGDHMGEKWWNPRWFERHGDQWIVREDYWKREFPYDIDLFGTVLEQPPSL